MIAEAVAFLSGELREYIFSNQRAGAPLAKDDIVIGNIAALDNDSSDELKNKVLISLVNIEEESTLKNGKHYLHNPLINGIEYLQPPVYLNLYLLFSVTSPDPPMRDNYETALHRLGLVLGFFQSKKSFTIHNSSQSLRVFPEDADRFALEEIRLLPELYTLTFEQINHLWGSLGGKQVPFVMYKVRLVKIQGRITSEAPLIEEIQERKEEFSAQRLDQISENRNANEDN